MQKYKKKTEKQEFSIFFCTFELCMEILTRMKTKMLSLIAVMMALVSCHQSYEHKTVVCIPVYGQSLALGEEAIRITDFDSLASYANGRIVTERLDHDFGYFDNDDLKQMAKRMLRYQKRSFELTVYSMAEMLADHTGSDTLICIFPGGQGATTIDRLGKGSEPYESFIDDIKTAYETAQERGWRFVMPALCWMQGETDVTDYPGTDYRKLFLQLVKDINDDVRKITGQKENVEIILYQTNPLTRAGNFNATAYQCQETNIPNFFMELVRDSANFHASGPTYPYTFVREAIHIDGVGQQLHGCLAALSALDILRHRQQQRGLLPVDIAHKGQEAIISFHVPCPPLVLDTLQVNKADHYGFSVITRDNRNILQHVSIEGEQVHLLCTEQPDSCRIRYAVNGEKGKSGRRNGPRGNLRDSQGDSLTHSINGKAYPVGNWCWQFDIPIEFTAPKRKPAPMPA